MKCPICEVEKEKQSMFSRDDSSSFKNHFQTVLAVAADGIHILDDQGNIVEFSDSFARSLGYTNEECAKLNVTDWEATIPKDQILPILHKLLGTQEQFETKHLRKDGTVIDVEVIAKGIEIDGKLYLYASSRDISARKLQEKELQLVRARVSHATIFEETARNIDGYAVFLLDPHGRVLTWNDGAKKLKGFSASEIIGKDYSEFFSTADRDANRPQKNLNTAIEFGKFEGEGWRKRKDGTMIFVSVVLTPIIDVKGDLLGFSKIVRDLTLSRRMKIQADLKQKIDHVLASNTQERDLLRSFLQEIASCLHLKTGAFWAVNNNTLVQAETFFEPTDQQGIQFTDGSRFFTFLKSEGLPGTAWQSGELVWYEDVQKSTNFPRKTIAAKAGIVSGFAFPLVFEDKFLGCIEFFTTNEFEKDEYIFNVLNDAIPQVVQRILFLRANRQLELQNIELLAAYNKVELVKKEIIQQQQFLQNIIDASPSAFFVRGQDGKYSHCNLAFERAFNMPRSKIIKCSPENLFPPDDLKQLLPIAKRVLETGESATFEYMIPTVAGRLWQLFTYFPIKNNSGKPVALGGIVTEIHKQKILRNHYESLFLALDSSAIVAMTDSKGKITFVNKKFCQISGYSEDELLGHDHRLLNSKFHPKEFFSEMWKTITSGKTWTGEIQNRRKDGSFYWVYTTIAPIKFEATGQDGFVAIRFDITEKKEAQVKLLKSSKMASLGEMTGGIAHEINTPLAIIHAKTVQLQTNIEKGTLTLQELPDQLKKIERTADRIAKIIKGLRVFSRNADHDPMETINILKLISDTLELCKERFTRQEIDLRVNVGDDILVQCRAVEVAQVLMNLLNNSFDAISTLKERWVLIDTFVSNNYLTLSVTDSGLGISSEIEEKIMQPFFTTKGVGSGTGLGLSISKGIVEAHGGSLKYDSKSKNTRFQIILPINPKFDLSGSSKKDVA